MRYEGRVVYGYVHLVRRGYVSDCVSYLYFNLHKTLEYMVWAPYSGIRVMLMLVWKVGLPHLSKAVDASSDIAADISLDLPIQPSLALQKRDASSRWSWGIAAVYIRTV